MVIMLAFVDNLKLASIGHGITPYRHSVGIDEARRRGNRNPNDEVVVVDDE
jgi:hypothetical protein